MVDPTFETDREFDVLKWGVVLNPPDPDIVVHLKQQFINGEISFEEFEMKLDSLVHS